MSGPSVTSGFCPRCGTPRREGATFCQSCGADLRPAPAGGLSEASARRRRGPLLVALTGGLALLIVIAIGAILVLSAPTQPTDVANGASPTPSALPSEGGPTDTPSSKPTSEPTAQPTTPASEAPTAAPLSSWTATDLSAVPPDLLAALGQLPVQPLAATGFSISALAQSGDWALVSADVGSSADAPTETIVVIGQHSDSGWQLASDRDTASFCALLAGAPTDLVSDDVRAYFVGCP